MKKFKKKIRINFLVLPISVLFPFCQKKTSNKQTNERKSLCRHCKKYGKNKYRQTYGWLNMFAMFAGKTL